MVLLILIGAMILVGVPLYIQYRMSGSPKANAPMPRAQSSWHHHHPTGKAKARVKASSPQKEASVSTTATVENKASENEGNKGLDSVTETNATAELNSENTQNPQNPQSNQTPEVTSTSMTSDSAPQSQEEESQVCCGLHEVCEKLATNSTKVEYFDDEELDAFAGRNPESYNDNEIDQFRDVMTTMYPTEVALWRQSLELRGVALPVELEDEFMLILSEV